VRADDGAEGGGVLAGGQDTVCRFLQRPGLGHGFSYPAPVHGALRAMLQFAGTTVDGETSAVYPPLLESDVRY
jgi:hypothetical protein